MLLFEIGFLHHCFNQLFSQIEKYFNKIRLCTGKAELMVKWNVMAWIWLGCMLETAQIEHRKFRSTNLL